MNELQCRSMCLYEAGGIRIMVSLFKKGYNWGNGKKIIWRTRNGYAIIFRMDHVCDMKIQFLYQWTSYSCKIKETKTNKQNPNKKNQTTNAMEDKALPKWNHFPFQTSHKLIIESVMSIKFVLFNMDGYQNVV